MASSPKEISRDIDDLIRWAYSDRFVLQHKGTPNQTRIYASQMDEVLKQKNRSERRILFLLMMRGRMLQPRISTRDIAKATGLSQVTVKKMLRRMIDANVIACTPETRFVLPDGSYSAMSRGYTVPHPAGSQYELHLQLTMKE